MDISSLVDFFSNGAMLAVPHPTYAVFFIARVIHGIFKTIGFDASRLKDTLGKIGLELKDTLINELGEVASKGVNKLADWLSEKRESLEVNDASAEIVASQSESIGEAFDQAEIDETERQKTAEQVKASLESMGGANKEIAEKFSESLLNPNMRKMLIEELNKNLTNHFSIDRKVREKGLIKDLDQIITMKGKEKGIVAEISAEARDEGKIVGGKSEITINDNNESD